MHTNHHDPRLVSRLGKLSYKQPKSRDLVNGPAASVNRWRKLKLLAVVLPAGTAKPIKSIATILLGGGLHGRLDVQRSAPLVRRRLV